MLNSGDILSNRYEVSRIIGQGGMSNVYLCKDLHLENKTCVLKELIARFTDPAEQAIALNQFKQEAFILAKLEHPNLPRVSDYFTYSGRTFLVMDYVEGKDLGKILQSYPGGMPEKIVIEYGIQIATVLYYLHMQKPAPLIFRDLKPSNIMVCGNHIKLIDFGIARFFSPAKKEDTLRIGSPGYSPPEQYGGQTDPRSDIYALGVVLHQLLTGMDPTSTQTPFHLPPVRNINPSISPQMEQIIIKATQLDPSRRYQSARDIKRDLQSLLPATENTTNTAVGATASAKQVLTKIKQSH